MNRQRFLTNSGQNQLSYGKRFLPLIGLLAFSATAHGQNVLGQPTMNSTSYVSRCASPYASFTFNINNGGMYGPSGIAVDPRGRLFVTDYGGQRVLTWPDFESLTNCQAADAVIGAGEMIGPESVTV
jgi:hypothetical protein